MPTTEIRPVYRLDLRDDSAEGSSPEINRLRSLLKRLLRAYGFRCLRVEELKQAEESTTINQDSI